MISSFFAILKFCSTKHLFNINITKDTNQTTPLSIVNMLNIKHVENLYNIKISISLKIYSYG